MPDVPDCDSTPLRRYLSRFWSRFETLAEDERLALRTLAGIVSGNAT